MSAPHKRIKTFLEASLALQDEVDLVLYQTNSSGRKAPVWRSDGRWDIDETIVQISENAQEFCNGLGTVTRFTVIAFKGGEDTDRGGINHTAFALHPADAGEADGALSEPANSEGLLAQLMRHNNELHRQSSGTVGMMFGYMTNIINRQGDQIDNLTKERIRNAETMEEIISKKHERDMEVQERRAVQGRRDDAMGKILSLLPVAINKLAGKEIVRQSDTLFEVTSSEFINSLNPSHLDAMLQSGVLDKHQLTLLSTMLEQVQKRMITVQEKAQGADKAKKAATNQIGSLGLLTDLVSLGK